MPSHADALNKCHLFDKLTIPSFIKHIKKIFIFCSKLKTNFRFILQNTNLRIIKRDFHSVSIFDSMST